MITLNDLSEHLILCQLLRLPFITNRHCDPPIAVSLQSVKMLRVEKDLNQETALEADQQSHYCELRCEYA